MRIAVLVALSLMGVMLAIYGFMARESDRPTARSVSLFLWSIIPAVAGNIMVLVSTGQAPAMAGYYLAFIGQDIFLAFLLKYVIDYCGYEWRGGLLLAMIYLFLTSDVVQLLFNTVFGHAFRTVRIMVNGSPYYQYIPTGFYHRYVSLMFLMAPAVLLIMKIIRTSSIYVEKYLVIFLSLLFASLWEAAHLVYGSPVDTTAIGYAVFGFLVYYFSISYNPRFLLDRMLSSVVSELPEALFFFDGENNCIWTNRPALELTGISEGNLDGIREKLTEMFPDAVEAKGEWHAEKTIGSGENASYYRLEKYSLIDKKKLSAGTFLSIIDDTDNRKKLERERYASVHDSLTGLYNKEHLLRLISETVKANPELHYRVAVIDVSEFKLINDVFGTDFGDLVLVSIANSIKERMPQKSVFGRLGGDSFGICVPGGEFDPVRLNERLSNYTVKRGDDEYHILMHIGIYEVDEPDLDPSIMFDRARMALSTIKQTYSHIAYYDKSIKDNMVWEQQISAELDQAIEERQIVPYLQPVVDTDGRVVGAEALARWLHPEKGLLMPADFIPQFESNGKISEVDRYIWRCACELLRGWEKAHPDIFLSVNISPIDFYYMDLRMELNHLVREFGIAPERLRLEITESVMMANVEDRIAAINGLREDGFVIEMDDFGSGFSSLNLLKDLPVDMIKVDMNFLRESDDNEKARIILDNVIKLIESLKIASLTEGVETELQFRTLAEMGCRLFQGFHFAKPIPASEFEEFCREHGA